jgi:hypothetical protein
MQMRNVETFDVCTILPREIRMYDLQMEITNTRWCVWCTCEQWYFQVRIQEHERVSIVES